MLGHVQAREQQASRPGREVEILYRVDSAASEEAKVPQREVLVAEVKREVVPLIAQRKRDEALQLVASLERVLLQFLARLVGQDVH